MISSNRGLANHSCVAATCCSNIVIVVFLAVGANQDFTLRLYGIGILFCVSAKPCLRLSRCPQYFAPAKGAPNDYDVVL